jgi:hypothetical protein
MPQPGKIQQQQATARQVVLIVLTVIALSSAACFVAVIYEVSRIPSSQRLKSASTTQAQPASQPRAQSKATTAAANETRSAPRFHETGYVSRAEFGDKWPLTVEEGVLRCDPRGALGAVLFETGGRRYAVNGTAKSLGHRPIDPIWRFQTQEFSGTVAQRLTESDRKRIFVEVVKCQDRGSGDEHDRGCKTQAQERNKLTTKELNQIVMEGATLSWPPLTPLRVSIGPLIDRGLSLCRAR